jgi:hypothetical protein
VHWHDRDAAQALYRNIYPQTHEHGLNPLCPSLFRLPLAVGMEKQQMNAIEGVSDSGDDGLVVARPRW